MGRLNLHKCAIPVWLIIGGLLLPTGIASGRQMASGYYIFDGKRLSRVDDASPRSVSATSWEMWLFRKGAPQAESGAGRWGTISGKSADQVLRELESSQKFERRWEGWCRCPYGPSTFFNALGPVAVVRTPVVPELRDIERLFDAQEVVVDGLNKIDTALGNVTTFNPFESVGNAWREYADNLKLAQDQLRYLSLRLPQLTNPAFEQSLTQLAGFVGPLRNVPSSAPSPVRMPSTTKPTHIGGRWQESTHQDFQSIATQQRVEISARLTAHHVRPGAGSTTFVVSPQDIAASRLQVAGGGTRWLLTIAAPGGKVLITYPDGSTESAGVFDLVFPSESQAQDALSAIRAWLTAPLR